MDRPDLIHLRDYIIAADIGAFQTERAAPQRLRFNIDVALAEPVSGAGDEVDRILSYDALTAAVTAALADERYNLLETLAERIAALILDHPRAAEVTVSVEKLDRVPGALGITLTRQGARVEGTAPDGPAPVIVLAPDDGARPALPSEGTAIIVPAMPGLPVPRGENERRIALLALDQAAWAMADDPAQAGAELTVADSRAELDWAVAEARRVIWAPARMAADIGDLPAQPFALACWLADRLGAQRIEVPGDPPAPPAGFRIPLVRSLA